MEMGSSKFSLRSSRSQRIAMGETETLRGQRKQQHAQAAHTTRPIDPRLNKRQYLSHQLTKSPKQTTQHTKFLFMDCSRSTRDTATDRNGPARMHSPPRRRACMLPRPARRANLSCGSAWCRSSGGGSRGTCRRGIPRSCRRWRSWPGARRGPGTCGSATGTSAPPPPPPARSLHAHARV